MRNVPVDVIYLVLLAMIALTVVMMMRVVGLILVIALLTMPAAISGQWVKDLKRMMALACLLGVIFTTLGLWLSYFLNLTSGATIILVSGAFYLLSLIVKSVWVGLGSRSMPDEVLNPSLLKTRLPDTN